MRDINNIVNDMPKLLKNAINALNVVHGAPMEMVVPLVLSTASIGAQLKYKLELNYGSNIPLSLWTIILADSGTRKSSVLSNILAPLKEYEKDLYEEYEKEYEEYEIQMSLWKKDRLQKNPEGLEKPIEVINPDIIIPTATLNGVINHLVNNSFGSLITPEGSQFFDGHSMTKSNGKREEMTSNLNALFSGDEIGKMTGVEKIKLYNRQLVLSLMTQPNLATILNDKKLQDQGFWARFMITQTPPSKKIFNVYNHNSVTYSEEVNKKMIYPLGNSIVDMIKNHKRQLSNHLRNGGSIGSLSYDNITLSKESADINNKWGTSFLEPLNQLYNKGQQVFDIPFIQRIQQFSVKIAAVITAFKSNSSVSTETGKDKLAQLKLALTANNEPTTYIIQPQEMKVGVELAEWFYQQRRCIDINDSNNIDEIVDSADALYKWLKNKNITETFKSELDKKALYQYRKKNKEVRKRIIEELLSVGKLTATPKGKTILLEVQ